MSNDLGKIATLELILEGHLGNGASMLRLKVLGARGELDGEIYGQADLVFGGLRKAIEQIEQQIAAGEIK